MKILVDKMPRNYYECPFLTYYIYKDKKRFYVCGFDRKNVEKTCPESCMYLAKGAVACELEVEADGETKAGEAV